jgi:hypothetical protein
MSEKKGNGNAADLHFIKKVYLQTYGCQGSGNNVSLEMR